MNIFVYFQAIFLRLLLTYWSLLVACTNRFKTLRTGILTSIYLRREENQLDANECFISLISRPTCFGHLYAHHQEVKTILVLLPHTSWLLVVGGQVQSSRLCVRWEGNCATQLSAIKHSVASSWFTSLRLYYDARTNIHQILTIFICFVFISEQTATSAPYNINWFVFL